MRLAKNRIDVGLGTNQIDAQLKFWQGEVGLPLEEVLPLGAAVDQHRHGLNGSVLKINAPKLEPLPDEPRSGYRELLIARQGIAAPTRLADPDGNRVVLVPPGYEGVVGLGMRLGVRDESAFHRFYGVSLGLEQCGEKAYRCGDSVLLFEHDAAAIEAKSVRDFFGPYYRYITIQVWDCPAEHTGILERGGTEGRPVVTAAGLARVSFVLDPDGNWIEISQRISLTGPLD